MKATDAFYGSFGARGIETIVTREPGGSVGAEAIRDLLMQGSDDRWDARTEALLFAAARADHVAKTIRPALESGIWVLCDRFVDSTRAYQGAGGGVDDADIMALHQFGSLGLLPHRTFLLTLSAEAAATRVAERDGDSKDRMGSKPDDYQQRLADRFAAMAAADTERWRVIDAGRPADAVTASILAELGDWL